ncbi:putative MFS transporter superfamily [Helianthus annuus]|nr:putative MFS transporter superfamily [Helianthus annuus]KAJ0515814.1 putative MFS transporter superfamily [Helianthus annuus]KAJ0683834.1 putative MFS transporter superfamily [Helianthus annuus]KAJ0687796.1 putative MFS transporter superfamily [Helianthus annuus]
MNYRTQTDPRCRTFTNINERTRPLFMFVHLTKRTKFLIRVRLFNKQTDTDELPAENVWFVCSPNCTHSLLRSIVSKQVGPTEQGKAQGCITGLSSLACIISPLIFSPLTALFLSDHPPFRFPGFSLLCVTFTMVRS